MGTPVWHGTPRATPGGSSISEPESPTLRSVPRRTMSWVSMSRLGWGERSVSEGGPVPGSKYLVDAVGCTRLWGCPFYFQATKAWPALWAQNWIRWILLDTPKLDPKFCFDTWRHWENGHSK